MGELGLEVLPASVLAQSMNLKLLSFRGSFFVVMCSQTIDPAQTGACDNQPMV